MIKMILAGCSKKAFDKLTMKSDTIKIGGFIQSCTLALNFYALLPKLMSGEIRVEVEQVGKPIYK
jgi:hypothetical protein